MRQEDRPEALAQAPQVRDVRDHYVDPQHLLVGEHDAAVDRDRRVPALEHEEVEADLAQAAQGDDAQGDPGAVTGVAHVAPAATAAPRGAARGAASSSSMKVRTRRISSSRSTPVTASGGPTTTSMSPDPIHHE